MIKLPNVQTKTTSFLKILYAHYRSQPILGKSSELLKSWCHSEELWWSVVLHSSFWHEQGWLKKVKKRSKFSNNLGCACNQLELSLENVYFQRINPFSHRAWFASNLELEITYCLFVQQETGTTNAKISDNRPLASRAHDENLSISHRSLDNIGFWNRSSLAIAYVSCFIEDQCFLNRLKSGILK